MPIPLSYWHCFDTEGLVTKFVFLDVPGDPGVPEPSTGLLLVFGTVMLLRAHRAACRPMTQSRRLP